jgi:hypothetical protein
MTNAAKPQNPIKIIKGFDNGVIWVAFPKVTEKWMTRVVNTVVSKSKDIYETKKYIQYGYNGFNVITTAKHNIKSLFLNLDDGVEDKIKIQEILEWKDSSRANIEFETSSGGIINAYCTDYLKNREIYINSLNPTVKLSALSVDGLEIWDYEKEKIEELEFSADFCGYSYIDYSDDLFEGIFIVETVNDLKIFDEDFWKLDVRLIQDDIPLIISLIANKKQSPSKVKVGDHFVSKLLFMVKLA